LLFWDHTQLLLQELATKATNMYVI